MLQGGLREIDLDLNVNSSTEPRQHQFRMCCVSRNIDCWSSLNSNSWEQNLCTKDSKTGHPGMRIITQNHKSAGLVTLQGVPTVN